LFRHGDPDPQGVEMFFLDKGIYQGRLSSINGSFCGFWGNLGASRWVLLFREIIIIFDAGIDFYDPVACLICGEQDF
jgi:hypothetical protein